ncbi:MAG: hypothetical protein E2O88_00555 [Bacteroidetes bacterium]|nr:MAG: hypothetical protein E2O88_00555 [Bacteroidota bacterium]
MKAYKFILTVLLVGSFSNFSLAQASINPGLAFGSEIETVGITLGGEYFVSSKVSIAPDFIFYLPNKNSQVFGGTKTEIKSKLWELNGNVHYYFVDKANIAFYGLGGLNYSHVGVEYKQTDVDSGLVEAQFDAGDGEVGINLGVGANFSIRKNFTPFTELKYVAGSTDQVVFSAGIKFELQ